VLGVRHGEQVFSRSSRKEVVGLCFLGEDNGSGMTKVDVFSVNSVKSYRWSQNYMDLMLNSAVETRSEL
jgi:hypothetical protein